MDIDSREALELWLADKPEDWAQALAIRAALLALPLIGRAGKDWLDRFAILPFRTVSLSWAAGALPSEIKKPRAALYVDHEGATEAEAFADKASYFAASTGPYLLYDFNSPVSRASNAISNADIAAERISRNLPPAFWQAWSADCQWLADNPHREAAAALMLRRPLWQGDPPQEWLAEWQRMVETLRGLESDYEVWIDWFNRRVGGEPSAFGIRGDKDRTEDKAILTRLGTAEDADFWDKGAAHVNATMQMWIDEAGQRIAEYGSTESHPVLVQNRNAIQFRRSASGRIALDADALSDRLRLDDDARDRHAEAVALAKELVAACSRSNAGARLTARLQAYLEAAGDAVEDVRPSLFVQRGERLRQELAGYEAPDSMLDPLADGILADLKSWRSAHNMTVGLDPVLMAMDTAQLGPDVQPAPLRPDEIRQLARDADASGALEDGVANLIIEAADLAPDIPDPTDRRTIWSSETAKNLVIEAFSVAANYPLSTVSGVVAFGAFGWTGAAVFGGALGAAKFLVNHRQWIERRLGNSPTWQSLFAQLCDRLEANTPFRPKDGDDGV